MQTGAFGKKIFKTSAQYIVTPNAISVSESLSYEMQDLEDGKPATYIKGLNAMKLSFSLQLNARFCDVIKEIDFWLLELRRRTPEFLSIGTKAFGTNKFLLTDVSISDIVTGVGGIYMKANIDLSFVEYTKRGFKEED